MTRLPSFRPIVNAAYPNRWQATDSTELLDVAATETAESTNGAGVEPMLALAWEWHRDGATATVVQRPPPAHHERCATSACHRRLPACGAATPPASNNRCARTRARLSAFASTSSTRLASKASRAEPGSRRAPRRAAGPLCRPCRAESDAVPPGSPVPREHSGRRTIAAVAVVPKSCVGRSRPGPPRAPSHWATHQAEVLIEQGVALQTE